MSHEFLAVGSSGSAREASYCSPCAKRALVTIAVALTIITLAGVVLCGIKPAFVASNLTAFATGTAVTGVFAVITLVFWKGCFSANQNIPVLRVDNDPNTDISWLSSEEQQQLSQALQGSPKQYGEFMREIFKSRCDEECAEPRINYFNFFINLKNSNDSNYVTQALTFYILSPTWGLDDSRSMDDLIKDHYPSMIQTLTETADPKDSKMCTKIVNALLGEIFKGFDPLYGNFPHDRKAICRNALDQIFAKMDQSTKINYMAKGFAFIEKSPNGYSTLEITHFYNFVLDGSHGIYDEACKEKSQLYAAFTVFQNDNSDDDAIRQAVPSIPKGRFWQFLILKHTDERQIGIALKAQDLLDPEIAQGFRDLPETTQNFFKKFKLQINNPILEEG